jgi:hypothetical protein
MFGEAGSWLLRCGGVALLGCLMLGCMEERRTTRETLPSGREIDVIHKGMVDETLGWWMLSYRTQIPLSDRERLEAEVIALWADIQPEVEGLGVKRASIWPTYIKRVDFIGWRPVFGSEYSTGYSLERDAGGTWVKSGAWSDACAP